MWSVDEIRKALNDEADDYVDSAHQSLALIQPMMAHYPLGLGQWLQALAHALSMPREIAIVGDPNFADAQALLNVARNGHRPLQVVALGSSLRQRPGHEDMQLAQAHQLLGNAADPVGRIAAVPLLLDRGLVDGRAAAYVCDALVRERAFACQAPVADREGLLSLLETH